MIDPENLPPDMKQAIGMAFLLGVFAGMILVLFFQTVAAISHLPFV